MSSSGWGRGFEGEDFNDFVPLVRDTRRAPMRQLYACATALLLLSSAGLAVFHARTMPIVTPMTPALATAALQGKPAAIALVRRQLSLLDPELSDSRSAASFARSAPLRSWSEMVGTGAPEVPLAPEASADPDRAAEATPASSGADPAAEAERRAEATPVAPMKVAEREVVPALPVVSGLLREVPLPLRRPAPQAEPRRLAQRAPAPLQTIAAAPTPADGRTLLERMFGTAKGPDSVLAYASPGEVGGGPFNSRATGYDGATAVYDIARHTVTLPNGTRLEAHSGLGTSLDDPRSVAVHMRGATPPNVYDLTPREAPFHGVRALRLTPVGAGATYGRAGLLAHTFMLGPRGDSNGCVVFRNYTAFLAAYEAGQIRRLVVVSGT